MLMLLPMTPQFLYPESDQIKGFWLYLQELLRKTCAIERNS